MPVRSQAMHLMFVVLSQSTRVGRERQQTPWGRGRPNYFYPSARAALRAVGGSLGAASGASWGICFDLHASTGPARTRILTRLPRVLSSAQQAEAP